jgi:hypothetical protein
MMDPESTPTSSEGQAPTSDANGQAPTVESTEEATPKGAAKTFDEAYVKQLRKEAATSRTELAEVKSALAELQDRDKSESQRLAERVAESERRASEAESRLLRYSIVAERGLSLGAAEHLAGSTREEFEASADWMAQQLPQQPPQTTPSFDGGARQTPEATKPPGQAHNDLLLRAMGRAD